MYAADLKAPGEILIDHWGVPHIYAADVHDLFFLQGFNIAHDRLWQIDLWRRRGLGRLAAALGPKFVPHDRAGRLFLYRGDMQREWQAYGPDARAIATAFVAGVNAYIKRIEEHPELLPPEFKVLGYAPELWRPEDVVRVRTGIIAPNLFNEIQRATTLCKYGAAAEHLRHTLQPKWTMIVPQGLDVCSIPPAVLGVYALLHTPVQFDHAERQKPVHAVGGAASGGSNNWVISPEKSATGRAVLANDPHRAFNVPSVRYIVHLASPELNLIGAGDASAPGVTIGHNDHISFGLTIFPADQEDLYVYETHPDDPRRYRYADGWEAMSVQRETVAVAGGKPVEVALMFTRHGPVIYEDPQQHRAYAVRSTMQEPGTAGYLGSLRFLRARNWQEFVGSLDEWGAPPENFVYADVQGNIGWSAGGLVPRRLDWDGLLPVPGDGRYEWRGFLSGDALPRRFNPDSGWLATANEFNLPADYPYAQRRLGFEWLDPARRERIGAVLGSRQKIPFEASMRLQNDVVSLPAQTLQLLLREIEPSEARAAAARELLLRWNGEVHAESAAAALYEVWFTRHLQPLVFKTLIGRDVPDFGPLGADGRTMIDLLVAADDRLGSNPGAVRTRILEESLRTAHLEISERLGDDTSAWRWGDLHRIRLAHPLAGRLEKERLSCALDVSLPAHGSGATVNSGIYVPQTFKPFSGASFRMVLDVGDWDRSQVINLPGQSGDPRSPYFCNLIENWRAGEYFPLLYSREAVERAVERRIRVLPVSHE